MKTTDISFMHTGTRVSVQETLFILSNAGVFGTEAGEVYQVGWRMVVDVQMSCTL